MAITLNNTSRADLAAPGATVTITKPTGTASTDVLILVIGSDRSGGASGSFTAPSGWTLIGQLLSQNDGGDEVSCQAWWALGSVANLGFTKSGTPQDMGWLCAAWTGVDNTTPIDATGTAGSTTTSTGSITAGAVTTVTDGALPMYGFADWASGTISSAGSITTALYNGAGNTPASNATGALVYWNSPKSPAGSTGTLALTDAGTTAGQVLIAIPFALRPAAGASFPGDEDEGVFYQPYVTWQERARGRVRKIFLPEPAWSVRLAKHRRGAA